MEPDLQLLCKHALKTLNRIGESGLTRRALLDQAARAADLHPTTLEENALIETLTDRGWVYSYRDPISNLVRFALSVSGRAAIPAL